MRKIDMIPAEYLEERLQGCLQERSLPDCFLYVGEVGTQNWIALDKSDRFPIASRLTDLLRESAPAIAGRLHAPASLVSVGVGDGSKERILLEALLAGGTARYCAVDVSSPMVDLALQNVADLDIEKTGIVAFCEDLARIQPYWIPPVLLCLLGNNFSNYDAGSLLENFSSLMEPSDLLLFDCHVIPDGQLRDDAWRRQVEGAYRSDLNIEFNISPLVRHGLNPDHCTFELDLLPVDTPFGTVLRTRKQIRILSDSNLVFRGGELPLEAGESIRMGFTYKYTAAFVEELLRHHGLRVVERFASEGGENILILATPMMEA